MWTLRSDQAVTVGRMVDEVAKYADFLKTAHGGITVQRRRADAADPVPGGVVATL